MNDCHQGQCEGEADCSKKVKLFCKCKRIKKDFVCSLVQKEKIVIECDEVCRKIQNERLEAQAALLEQQRREEELRNEEEMKKFTRKFKPRRKGKDRFDNKESFENDAHNYKWIWILAVLICIISVAVFYINMNGS